MSTFSVIANLPTQPHKTDFNLSARITSHQRVRRNKMERRTHRSTIFLVRLLRARANPTHPTFFTFDRFWVILKGRNVVLEIQIHNLNIYNVIEVITWTKNCLFFHNWINKVSSEGNKVHWALSEARKVKKRKISRWEFYSFSCQNHHNAPLIVFDLSYYDVRFR